MLSKPSVKPIPSLRSVDFDKCYLIEIGKARRAGHAARFGNGKSGQPLAFGKGGAAFGCYSPRYVVGARREKKRNLASARAFFALPE